MATPKDIRRAEAASRTAGLSHLADIARQETGTENYPVRKKGERRRLLPNTEAIQWLEEATQTDTETHLQEEIWEDGEPTGRHAIRATGWGGARFNGMHPRQMFDLHDPEAGGGLTGYSDPCPACYDYSRSWACQEHPEVPWNAEHRCWVHPDDTALQAVIERSDQRRARLASRQEHPAPERPTRGAPAPVVHDGIQAGGWVERYAGLLSFSFSISGAYFASADIMTELTDENIRIAETGNEDTTT